MSVKDVMLFRIHAIDQSVIECPSLPFPVLPCRYRPMEDPCFKSQTHNTNSHCTSLPFLKSLVLRFSSSRKLCHHNDVIKWKDFPRYWPFVRGIHSTKASDAELWCFLWSAPEKRLSKQSWGWWFETLSPPLWRHCNDSYFFFVKSLLAQSAWWLPMWVQGVNVWWIKQGFNTHPDEANFYPISVVSCCCEKSGVSTQNIIQISYNFLPLQWRHMGAVVS